MNSQLSAAYSVCGGIARREAKNFYYAFLALPAHKRRALNAIYAFMRQADDISDETGVPAIERKAKLQEWIAAWHRALAGEPTDDPVFLAVGDTVRRFDIAPQRLDELVQGVAMDLDIEVSGATQSLVRYQSFDELYRYCYYVASVVGLVCIRIFGYRDARAELLAERTGIAFQLTNIIRDVREDAQMGRVYLPAEDLQRFGIDIAGMTVAPGGTLAGKDNVTVDPARFKPLLRFEADRAREYYRSAHELLPLISADSRSCLRVLVDIYARLLERISERDFDVLSERVALSGWEKTSILLAGIAKGLLGNARA